MKAKRKIKHFVKKVKFKIYVCYLIKTCGNVNRDTYLLCLNCRKFACCQKKFLNRTKWIS